MITLQYCAASHEYNLVLEAIQWWDFLALDGPARPHFAIPRYSFMPLPLQKRGRGHKIQAE